MAMTFGCVLSQAILGRQPGPGRLGRLRNVRSSSDLMPYGWPTTLCSLDR
jgi:hypothetical protein